MKHPRSVLVLLGAALFTLPARAAEGGWMSWWRNADQRGEQLLQEGDAATAATVFADPRRKAYAKLMAGDYQQAAQDLSAFDDGDAHYNRGNALAHARKLPEALQAYDLALKRDPNNQDARHNRDLVASALKQQSPEKQAGGDGEGNPQDGKDRGDQGSQQGSQKGEEQPSSSSSSSASSSSSSSSASSSAQNATPSGTGNGSEHPAKDPPAEGRQAPGDGLVERGKRQDGASGGSQPSPARAPTLSQQADAADPAEQARRDVAASLAQASAGHAGADAAAAAAADIGKDREGRGESPLSAPPSEQQLAQQQWLRSIPDDPGGLLRRKFLVEHLLRQQKSQP